MVVQGTPSSVILECRKGTRQKLLSGFYPLRGYPSPPYPLNFAKKNLSGKGGVPPPPPLNGKLPKIFLKKWVKKG